MQQPPEPRFLDDRPAYWAEHTPDNEAMTYLSRSWTWSQWYERIRRCAGALQARGIGRGDVLAFLDKNHPACVEVTVAASSLGAAAAIINFRLAGEEMDYVLNDCGAKLLVVSGFTSRAQTGRGAIQETSVRTMPGMSKSASER